MKLTRKYGWCLKKFLNYFSINLQCNEYIKRRTSKAVYASVYTVERLLGEVVVIEEYNTMLSH